MNGIARMAGHYVEMLVAMFVGMGLFALPWMLLWPGLSDHPVLDTLVMVANMMLGMALWMAIRRHNSRMIIEMSAAMAAPFVVLLAPLAAGAITVETLSSAGHVLMFATMLGAMLVRRHEYLHRHGAVPTRIRSDRPVPVAVS